MEYLDRSRQVLWVYIAFGLCATFSGMLLAFVLEGMEDLDLEWVWWQQVIVIMAGGSALSFVAIYLVGHRGDSRWFLTGTYHKVMGTVSAILVVSLILLPFSYLPAEGLMWEVGLSLMVVGGLMALGQWDMKRLFAYSSISQVGLILLALGFGTTWGVVGALYHLVNQAACKPLLFLNSGAVEAVAGTRDLREIHGLGRTLPVSSATSLVGSLSLAGVPPFNGFWSKLIIVFAGTQAEHTGWAILVVLMSIVTLAYQLKVQKEAFFSGGTRGPDKDSVSADAGLGREGWHRHQFRAPHLPPACLPARPRRGEGRLVAGVRGGQTHGRFHEILSG